MGEIRWFLKSKINSRSVLMNTLGLSKHPPLSSRELIFINIHHHEYFIIVVYFFICLFYYFLHTILLIILFQNSTV